jgi:hypothetical protein
MPSDAPNENPTTGRRLVRCNQCGRNGEVGYKDLLRYTRAGWPMCCGQVMGYYAEIPRPSAKDETDEGPALPPGT